MPGARWDFLSGALNLFVALLLAVTVIGPQSMSALQTEDGRHLYAQQADSCDQVLTLPSAVRPFLEFADRCLDEPPHNMALLEGDMLAMFQRLNEIRVENDLPELQWHQGAADVARLHGIDMLRREYFDHSSPEGLRNEDRMRRLERDEIFGVTGENLAWFRDGWPESYTDMTLQLQLEGSASHFGTMVNPDYSHVGLAIVKQGTTYTAVQVFLSAEGILIQEWPDVVHPGESLSLPAQLDGRKIEGWRLESPTGTVIARGYDTLVRLPEFVSEPGRIRLVVLVAATPTSYLLLNGPSADLVTDAF